MSLFFCNWYVKGVACGKESTRVIVDSGTPDRHVCTEHYEMWRKFILRKKEEVLCQSM